MDLFVKLIETKIVLVITTMKQWLWYDNNLNYNNCKHNFFHKNQNIIQDDGYNNNYKFIMKKS